MLMNKKMPRLLDSLKLNEISRERMTMPDNVHDTTNRALAALNRMQQIEAARIEDEKMQEKKHREETLNTLKNIEKNTGDISQLVFLLNSNTEKQTEILEVMTEILSLGTSETNEEAESKYRKIMSKITQTFEDAETIEKLLSYSKVFYHAAIEYIKNRIENG